MNLFFLVCIIFTTVRHIKKFGQIEREGDRSLFFINENKKIQVYVDGYPTGIQGSGLLFVDPCVEKLNVEFRLGRNILETRVVTLDSEALWIMGPVGTPLFPVAGVKALV